MNSKTTDSKTDERLFKALDALETAIKTAKGKISSNPARHAALARLTCYETMVEKQRILAEDMIVHRENGNWGEFKRRADLLSGTSQMIQLDVLEILGELSGGRDRPGSVSQ